MFELHYSPNCSYII